MTPAERETYDERYAIVIADKASDAACNEATAHRVALEAVERERVHRSRGEQLGMQL